MSAQEHNKGLTNNGYTVDKEELEIPMHTDVADDKTTEDEDIWKLKHIETNEKDWKDLSPKEKAKKIVLDYILKPLLLICCLYMFICSLDFLSNAFRLIGGKTAGSVFSESALLSNPVAGLMIGVLGTVLLQSSSTTTTIVVSMVASKIVTVELAIPIIMGANIGTSVTNTIVSIGQINNKNEFRRAFAGATLLDMFNWLSVVILLPLEAATGYLYRLTNLIVKNLPLEENDAGKQEFLTIITRPFTELIIQVDKKLLEDIAENIPGAENRSMIKHCCDEQLLDINITTNNLTDALTGGQCLETCKFLFEDISNTWSDTTVGIVLLFIALVILCTCLVSIVKTLNSLLQGKVAGLIKKFINAEFPGKFAYFTGYVAILIGTGLTIIVQSSSVFTSALTPLVGLGVISIDRMYPLTLGANIGTTTTAILAALAQEPKDIPISLQISFCHLFFNISGILMFYPLPFLRFPIDMAKFLGNETAKYRWFALLYLILSFFVLPAVVFGLSMVSWKVMVGVLVPIGALIIFVAIMKIIQRKLPKILPVFLRNWKFLPTACRSLEPYDNLIQKLTFCCTCCRNRKNKNDDAEKRNIDLEHDTHM